MHENDANRVLNFLAARPRYGHTTATRAEVRKIMLKTGGQMFAGGLLWDIVAKPLGAGVYRVSLKEWNV